MTHIGGPAPILVGAALVMAPVVRSSISDSAVIGRTLDPGEAERIADGVNRRGSSFTLSWTAVVT